MNDHPRGPELRRALLAETEPGPGMADRVLAGFPPASSRRRASWPLGAVAVLLALLIAATLLLTGRVFHRPTVPAAPPAAGVPPPVLSARPLAGAALAADGTGWVLESSTSVPQLGAVTLYRTTDGGAHWSSRLDVGTTFVSMRSEPGGRALLYAMEGPQSFFYSTTDGGATWQRYPSPATGLDGPVWLKDAHEAWAGAWIVPSDGPPTAWDLYHTTDAGRTWQRQATVDAVTSFGSDAQGPMTFVDATHGVYIQAGGNPPLRTYATADGGEHWQAVAVPGPSGESLTPANAATDVAAVLPNGHLVLQLATNPQGPAGRDYTYTSDDGGMHWSGPRPLPATGVHGALLAVDDAHWWWVAQDGRVFTSADQGQRWSPAGHLPGGLTMVQGGFTSPADGWAIASGRRGAAENVLLVTADGGRTWRSIAPPHPIHPAVPCSGGAPVPVTAHAHLTLLLNGRAQPYVPAGVGVTDGCRYRLFTSDASGTIDIATAPGERGRRYTLGDFLDVWGVTDVRTALPSQGPGTRVAVRVDGRPYGGDPRAIPLRDGTEVELVVTAPTGGG